MDYSMLVGFLQTLGDLDGDIEGFCQRQRAFLDLFRQRRPVNVGHCDERLSVFLVDAKDLADAGVVQRGSRLGFPDQAGLDLLFAKRLAEEELESNGTLEVEILGLPDLAHRSLAELLEDLIVADRAPRHDAQIVLRRLGSENKRCHKLPAEGLRNTVPEGSKALQIGFRAF